jgi:hypothetical protein
VIATEFYGDGGAQSAMVETVDIDELRAEVERLRAALAHMASLAMHIGDMAAGIAETADSAKGGK